jgi:glycosyltransferase involved in cell wall biosynthesis
MPVAHPVADRKPLISVIIPHYNLGTYLHRTVDSVLASSYANLEVIIVDDASTDPVSIATIERLAAIGGERLKIVRSTFNRGLAATRNAALDACTGEFVLPLDADDVIAPQFIEIGVAALVKNPAYDFVVPQIAYFSDRNEGDIYTKAELDDGYVLIGEARASGLHMNRYATATVLARAKTLKSLRYREELEFYEDWDLYQRAVSAGHRMLVTSSIQFFYRHRHDSMIHSAEGRARHHLAYHDVLRTRSMTMEGMRVPAYALQGFTAGAAALGESTVELRAQLEELQRSEVVRVSLALARLMQNRAPWLVNFARKGVRRGWKVIRRLRRR